MLNHKVQTKTGEWRKPTRREAEAFFSIPSSTLSAWMTKYQREEKLKMKA